MTEKILPNKSQSNRSAHHSHNSLHSKLQEYASTCLSLQGAVKELKQSKNGLLKASVLELAAWFFVELGDVPTAEAILEKAIEGLDPVRDTYFLKKYRSYLREVGAMTQARPNNNNNKKNNNNNNNNDNGHLDFRSIANFWIMRSSGPCLYEHKNTRDCDLVCGFFSAIRSFSTNLSDAHLQSLTIGHQHFSLFEPEQDQDAEDHLLIVGQFPGITPEYVRRKYLEDIMSDFLVQFPGVIRLVHVGKPLKLNDFRSFHLPS